MSIHISSRVWKHCEQSGDRLLLMLALADYSNDEGICWPSQTSLAARTRCTERGVRKMVDGLIEDGELELVRRGNGAGCSSVYRLTKYTEKEERECKKEERGSGFEKSKKEERQCKKEERECKKEEQLVPGNHQEPSREPSEKKENKNVGHFIPDPVLDEETSEPDPLLETIPSAPRPHPGGKTEREAALRANAAQLLAHLRDQTGRDFRDIDSNLKPIIARLKEPGVTVDGVGAMIDRQVELWMGTEMETYLRPSTLFRESKFDGYYSARSLPVPARAGKNAPAKMIL